MEQQKRRNDLERIQRVLGATNPNLEWLSEQVPALVDEIQWLRWDLDETLHTQDMLLEKLGVSCIEELYRKAEVQDAAP